MAQYGFFFDNSRCTGCKTCMMACKDYNDLNLETAYRKVYDYEGGQWQEGADGTYTCDSWVYHLSTSCQHCEHPACVANCPTTAMHKDPDTGLVSVDASKCIGCGYCAMACPYNAPKVDREVGHSVKCDGCSNRVAKGMEPICVGACPLRAIEFGEFEELQKKHPGAVRGIAPMPDPSVTNPHVLIKASAAAKEPGDTTGRVGNPKEVA